MGGGADPFRQLCTLATTSALNATELHQHLEGLCKPPAIDWVVLVGTVLGGLSIFLYGMEKMCHKLKEVAGDGMKRMLQTATRNRALGAIAGFVATAVLSSSSAASVLVISFVEAGLMPFESTLGMLLGINVGTTITMHLTTTSIMHYAMHLVAIGFFGEMFSKSEARKAQWGILNGLGLLFYSMEIMGGAMGPLRHSEAFRGLMRSSDGLRGVLISTIFTLVIQSSSAATAVISQLGQQQLLSCSAGLALVLGANIGTCGTACLAAIGKRADTRRVAAVYLVFKVVGVILTVPVLSAFERYVADFVVASGFLSRAEVASTADCPGEQGCNGMAVAKILAWSHTLFNLLLVCIFLPVAGPLANLIKAVIAENEHSAKWKNACAGNEERDYRSQAECEGKQVGG